MNCSATQSPCRNKVQLAAVQPDRHLGSRRGWLRGGVVTGAVRSEGADICIVGAGVMGTSIAYQLARKNLGRIVICDQGSVGEGMSGRSSALIRMHYTFREEVELAVHSLRMFREWPQIMGGQPVFQAAPFVRIVHPDEIGKLRQNVAMQRECGARVELIDRATLAGLAPSWAVEDVALAAYEPESGYASGGQVAADLLNRAQELGVVYGAGTRVLELRRRGDQVIGVATSEGPIDASLVICATGVWSRPLLRAAGWDPPIESELHHVALIRSPETSSPASIRSAGPTSDPTCLGPPRSEAFMDPGEPTPTASRSELLRPTWWSWSKPLAGGFQGSQTVGSWAASRASTT